MVDFFITCLLRDLRSKGLKRFKCYKVKTRDNYQLTFFFKIILVRGYGLFYPQFYILLLLMILYYVHFMCLSVLGVKGLYQIIICNNIFKSQHLSHFETYIETFSSQNASFNRKQNITLLVILGTKGLNYF